jgi:uncharacterized protein DUF4167
MNPNIGRRGGAQRPRLQGVQRPQSGAGNAHQKYERYLVLGREAQRAGDAIEMENYYQHAEHYFRVMRAASERDPGKGRSHAYGPSSDRL